MTKINFGKIFSTLGAACLFAMAAFPAFAQEEPIQQTITSQFEALQADDFAAAFGLASVPASNSIDSRPSAMLTRICLT